MLHKNWKALVLVKLSLTFSMSYLMIPSQSDASLFGNSGTAESEYYNLQNPPFMFYDPVDQALANEIKRLAQNGILSGTIAYADAIDDFNRRRRGGSSSANSDTNTNRYGQGPSESEIRTNLIKEFDISQFKNSYSFLVRYARELGYLFARTQHAWDGSTNSDQKNTTQRAQKIRETRNQLQQSTYSLANVLDIESEAYIKKLNVWLQGNSPAESRIRRRNAMTTLAQGGDPKTIMAGLMVHFLEGVSYYNTEIQKRGSKFEARVPILDYRAESKNNHPFFSKAKFFSDPLALKELHSHAMSLSSVGKNCISLFR